MYPALAVVSELRKPEQTSQTATEFFYIGRAGAIEERLAQRAGIPFQSIDVGGIHGLAPWAAMRNATRLLRATLRVKAVLATRQPDVVLATGGYVSAPVIWAAAWQRVPSVIYLPDLAPGWAIHSTARWATRIAVTFPEVAKYFDRSRVVVTGYPVRGRFYQANCLQARRTFGLAPDERTITIFGGSHGAHRINEAVVSNLEQLTRLAQLIHLTGGDDEQWVKAQVERLPQDLRAKVRVFGYLDDELPDALAAGDVVVARAGAAILGEFPALGVPAILVPYPFAGRHQEMNARYLADRGAAVCLDDAAVRQALPQVLERLLREPDRLERMKAASRACAQPHAAERLADLLRSVAKEPA